MESYYFMYRYFVFHEQIWYSWMLWVWFTYKIIHSSTPPNLYFFFCKLHFEFKCHLLCGSALQNNFNSLTSGYIRNKTCNKKRLEQVTVLNPIHMLYSSWRNITDKYIKSYFNKAGFSFPADNVFLCVDPEKKYMKII